jgi:hypothetical protein
MVKARVLPSNYFIMFIDEDPTKLMEAYVAKYPLIRSSRLKGVLYRNLKHLKPEDFMWPKELSQPYLKSAV